MGYRSTFITQHYGHTLPDWFIKKHSDNLHIQNTLISSAFEFKLYWKEDLFPDYQKALIETGILENGFVVEAVVLGEDGLVTKIKFSKEKIEYFRMEETFELDDV